MSYGDIVMLMFTAKTCVKVLHFTPNKVFFMSKICHRPLFFY